MRIIEFIHDQDHPETTNVDLWAEEYGFQTRKLLVYKEAGFPKPVGYDLIILHGGAQHLWDKDADPWLYKEVRYVREALQQNKPVLGLCLGGQILADALGGRVYQAKEKEVGWYKVRIWPGAGGHPLLQGLEEGFVSFMWHSDHYELPGGCVAPAFTEAAPNQIFYHNDLPAVGFQFHPEYSREIIRGYCETYYEESWIGDRYLPPKEDFLKELAELPNTYGLFKKLMNNTVKWFSKS